MELSLPLIIVPPLIALMFKAGIYAYAWRTKIHNLQTRLYLLFLFSFSIQNIAEIFGLYKVNVDNIMPHFEAGLFYGAVIVALALFFHLAVAVAFDQKRTAQKIALVFVYSYAAALQLLLVFTTRLIQGFETLEYNNFGLSITRVPGPLYFLFELYVIGLLIGSIGILTHGARKQGAPRNRAKNLVLLAAIVPTTAAGLLVIGLLHFGIKWINTSVIFPTTITFFLVLTAYATHQHRIFDIQFFIPWSKVRARKTAFYDRIRAMITEVADLGSVREAVLRLADTLRCPVALVSTAKPVLAVAGGAQSMVSFPLEQLHRIDRIMVANEIADARPETYTLMRSHGIAAIVPFYPHSQNASGWMLLGDAFSEQVYTPLDFRMVERLFDRMAELFLDKLLLMRSQLATAERRLQTAESRLQQTEAGMVALRGEIESLREQNRRLAREQAADSLIAAETPAHGALPNIILLGRDKPMLKLLRRHFPQADQYVGPDSASFRRQDPPEVLVCRLDADRGSDDAWLALLTQQHGRVAALLYGNGAQEFIATHLEPLAGALVEILPDDATDEAIARRIQALANLRRGALAVPDADCPLIGVSQPFQEAMRDAARLAGFVEPVLIESGDARELATVARYIHSLSGRPGEFHMLPAAEAAAQPSRLTDTLAAYEGGTLLLTGADTLAPETLEPLIATTGKARLLLGAESTGESLRARFRSFALRLPTLRERRLDLPLLVHYFTLQYNLRAGTQTYLTQTDVDELMAVRYPANMDALRAEVFDRLNAKHRVSAPAPEMELALADKTLDEHVATFETRLIAQTLERCQGNKSKAARLLGLRPNTLHYKLERYGLGGKKDKSETD